MRSKIYIVMLFCLSISAIFGGCTESEYGEGKSEPVSFSAKICSRTQTRAVVDTAKNSGSNLIVSAAEPAKGIILSVSKMTRTSTADGSWSSGENIAVQQNGTTKQYTVDGDGNITSSSPFYWVNKNDVSVTSWYPYSASLSSWAVVNNDQSNETNYDNSDLLYSSGILSYDGSKTLQYSHQTAKVVINIVKADNLIKLSNISSITIGTSNTPIILSGTVGSNGSITASTTTGYITPYQTTSSNYVVTYSALVIPQEMKGKQFIAINATNGVTYYYKPSTSTILSGGYEYDYNITVPYVNIGDYYYSDGTWGTNASPSGKTVIGIVFQNNPNRISETEKNKGWNHGYAMAITEASNSAVWGPLATDEEIGNVNTAELMYQDINGYNNTTYIINEYGNGKYSGLANTNYKAFYYATQYGSSTNGSAYSAPNSSSGWYLGSQGQWWDLMVNLGNIDLTSYQTNSDIITNWIEIFNLGNTALNNINALLAKINGSTSFPTDDSWYISSSQLSSDRADDMFCMSNGSFRIDSSIKNNGSNRVRSILAF